MKTFLEEYGFVILIAIVIILLVVIATPVGRTIKTSILGLTDDFDSKTAAKIDKTRKETNTTLKGSELTIESTSETDKYIAILRGYQGGKEVSVASDGNSLTCTDNMSNTATFDDITVPAETSGGLAKFNIVNGDKLDENSKYYVEIMNVGTEEVFKSDIAMMDYQKLVSDGDSGSTGNTLDISNIDIAGVKGDFSSKGNLVTINGTQYRVLTINGTQVKVMSMASVGDSAFNSSNVTTSFGSYTGQKYENSKLDQSMTNYYNSLPEAIKTAIVPQTIKQSMYSHDNPTRLTHKIAEIEVGQRYIYALDVDDVIEYLGNDYSSGSPYVVNKMFFDTTSLVSRYVWLRSASPDHSYSAFFVYGNSGFLGGDYYSNLSEVRPTFVLDLSLLHAE